MSDSRLERETMRVVYWHFTPLFFVIMLMNYLDRFNIGFAAIILATAIWVRIKLKKSEGPS